jgi:hypothetical protein
MSPDRSPQGRPTLTCTAVKDGDDLSDRLGDGPCCTCPASCDARESLTGSPTRVTSSRNALTARTKRYGLTSRSTGLKTQLSAACLLLRGQLTCLPSCPRWATRDGKLPAQTLRSIVPSSQIGFQSKWRQKRGAFGISTAPWCRARSRLTTRKASKKWWLNSTAWARSVLAERWRWAARCQRLSAAKSGHTRTAAIFPVSSHLTGYVLKV